MGVVCGVMGLAALAVAGAVGVASYIDYLENAKRQAKTWAESSPVQNAFAGEQEETKQCGTAMQGIQILQNQVKSFAPKNQTRAAEIMNKLGSMQAQPRPSGIVGTLGLGLVAMGNGTVRP